VSDGDVALLVAEVAVNAMEIRVVVVMLIAVADVS